MKFKPTPIASAVFLAFAGSALPALAQQAPSTQETITVTGIRASVEKSIQTKKNADGVVEVVSQEDIGKMPDKNVADAVQRLPGVTISSQSGGSGGFDENDRVSMRGTNPSLTQTLINGHPVASGDWFVLDQVGLVGRSVSFSMLPSEIVSQVIVRKTATADLVEGGVAGAVDIITLKPLDFRKRVSAEASIGAVYADLPKKWDGQVNGLVNWKNDANTFGVMVQGFDEKRHLRRDGQEILGYGQIAPTNPIAVAKPDLANVFYPQLIGSAFFEQQRERKGGLIDIQVKPSNDLSIDLSGFTSRLDATNYNRNWMMWGTRIVEGSRNADGSYNQAPQVPTTYTVRNGTLVAATWPNRARNDGGPSQYAIVDEIYRPGAYSETNFIDLDAKWRMSDAFTVSGKVGSTRGKGVTPVQAVFEGDVFSTGANYSMNGTSSPVNVAFPNGNPSNFAGTSLDWIFGASPASTEDKEKYAQADGEWAFGGGMFNNLKFGGRWAEHTRDTHQVAQGPNFAADPFNPANLPAWAGQTYPSDFGNRLGGDFPRQPWMLDPGVLSAWADRYANRDPVARQFWPGEFSLKETVNAAYVMTNLEGRGWSGNLGVRLVQTKERVTVNVAIVCPPNQTCPPVPGAITTSAFGPFYQKLVSNDYNDVLPSANLRVDLGNNMIARFAAARTMARPDYSALGGSITADDTTHTGSGGNPNLKPIRSWNYDAAFEWYYAPRSLLSAGVFYMDLQNYVAYGTYQTTLLNIRTGTFDTYTISAPINSKGRIYGIELAWQQPIAWGFGVQANYTYADAYEKNAACYTSAGATIYGPGGTVPQSGCSADLVGASKNTYNLSAYYENGPFGARLNYTYRSHFFVGLDRSTPQYQDDVGVLSASLNYDVMRNVSLHFDALNLNDPVLKMYGANTDQPRAFYANGRQYYFTVRVKF
jgi:iron complex outermembrane receptor protein